MLDLPTARTTTRSTAFSCSTASSTIWSIPSAPAMRCSPIRRSRCSPAANDASATIIGALAAACECEFDGNIPITPEHVVPKAGHGRTADELRLSVHARDRRRTWAYRATSGAQFAGEDFVATSIRYNPDADYQAVRRRTARSPTMRRCAVSRMNRRSKSSSYLLEHGKHVLVEKPLWSVTDDGIEALQALARKAGVVCYTAYNHRFEPHFVRMRDLIASGELGRIYSLPHVLRQRHGPAGPQFGMARQGRRRAAGPWLASARHVPVLVRRHR